MRLNQVEVKGEGVQDKGWEMVPKDLCPHDLQREDTKVGKEGHL